MKDSKKVIGIFFGGYSTEYEVSLQSAYSVIGSIDTSRYRLVLVGIDRNSGKWFWYRGEIKWIERDLWQTGENLVPVFPLFDRNIHGIGYLDKGNIQTISLDAALPILHGKNGEDGTIQGTLELMGVPVIGCGSLSSAICMDKELAHRIVERIGIKVASSITVKKEYQETAVREAAFEIGYPLFVKPVRSGSSFGITKVLQEKDLISAIDNAFLHDSTVILEEAIDGFEVGCAVLGTTDLLIGEVDEIELSDGFFDYMEKYTLKTSSIHVPARISREKSAEIKETALAIYRILQCSYFARVDMFLTPRGEIYFNEVNTIPGFTSHSRFPGMFKAIGLSFEELVNRLLELEG